MGRKIISLKNSLYLLCATCLLVGLGSSVLIYLFAGNDPDDLFAYQDSKMYLHDLELYGGKVNILTNDIMRWFSGLWHGRSLALTVACITVSISLVLFFVANRIRSDS